MLCYLISARQTDRQTSAIEVEKETETETEQNNSLRILQQPCALATHHILQLRAPHRIAPRVPPVPRSRAHPGSTAELRSRARRSPRSSVRAVAQQRVREAADERAERHAPPCCTRTRPRRW